MPRAGSNPPRPARKMGKTMSMVRDLPESGSIVIVHFHGMRDYVESMIMGLRGNDVLRNTRVLVVSDVKVASALRLAGLPVRVDHAYYANVPPEVADFVRALAAPAAE